MSSGQIDELRKVVALQGLPEEQLQWILDHADYFEFEDGHLLSESGKPIDELWFISDGNVVFYMDINGKLVKYFTFGNDKETGGLAGLLPYSRMTSSPGNSYADGTVKTFSLHKNYFHELEQRSPELIQRLVGYMTERARSFATVKLQHEKVSALGQLAAGIAHELNNPAAAISRIAEELRSNLNLNYILTEKMIEQKIDPQHIRDIFAITQTKEIEAKGKLSGIQRLHLEDAITDWLEDNGFSDNLLSTDVFVEAAFTVDDFETILKNTGRTEFIYMIQWLENVLSSRQLIKDMDIASSRISQLVGAVKSHVHMDRTNEKQATDIHLDIDNTLTLLNYKLRQKNITVEKKFCENMRKVVGFVGELNQVWTNLIDNAIYAMSMNGTLTIETVCKEKDVSVCIIDNGIGIPKENLSRIFDPFFSTKKVGEGTGIGLNLVSRIVQSHHGEIKVSSEPGRTAFKVCLPMEGEGFTKSPLYEKK